MYLASSGPLPGWIRSQGRELVSDGRLHIRTDETESRLTLDSITADEGGKYVVSVENTYGADCHFASVAVEGTNLQLSSCQLGSDSLASSSEEDNLSNFVALDWRTARLRLEFYFAVFLGTSASVTLWIIIRWIWFFGLLTGGIKLLASKHISLHINARD